MEPISRQKFLQQSALAGAAVLLSSLEGWAQKADKKLKVAVIGCGSVSNRYIPHLQTSAMIEIVSLCDIKYERAMAQNNLYKVNAATYPSIEKMLAGVPFDLMVTLTDMQLHGELNRKALLAGKHVWSEKPMANTYAEGKALLNLAISKKLKIWGAPAVVNSPQFAFMSKCIQEGKLGRVASAHGQYGHVGPSWSAFFYEKGGGSMPDLGVYNIATLTGLLGPARSVMAMLSIVNPERTIDDRGKIKVEVEDNAHILMMHDKNVISHVMCGPATVTVRDAVATGARFEAAGCSSAIGPATGSTFSGASGGSPIAVPATSVGRRSMRLTLRHTVGTRMQWPCSQ